MNVETVLAASGYARSRAVGEAEAGQGAFAQAFGSVVEGLEQTLQRSQELSKAALTGQADPTELVQALAQTELAVETAVAVRDKVVGAYQEILRMQI